MMIRVIKHGKKRRAVCGYCGCEMEFEASDIQTNQIGINEYERVVKCPDCGLLVGVRD